MADDVILFPMSGKDRKLLATALKALAGAESSKIGNDFSAEQLADLRELRQRVETAE